MVPGTKAKQNLQKLAITALFLGLVAACKPFSFTIPLFGASGMKVGFAGIFTAFPTFLFGPVYGGVASAASDILGCIIAPIGAYNPIFTIVAFIGGFIKGLMWKLLGKSNGKKTRIIAICLIAAIGVFGAVCHVILVNDGVAYGLISTADELPNRKAVENAELSPISSAVTGLAAYNNDTITLSHAVAQDGVYTVPSTIVYPDGYTLSVTKIGEDAFSGGGFEKIIIPSTVKTIDEKAFSNLEGVVIAGAEGSKAQEAAEKAGLAFEAAEPEKITFTADASGYSDIYGSFSNSETFRRNLAGYINFVTIGLEGTALLGFVYIAAEALINRARRKKGKEGYAPHVRIFASIFVSGMIVTTINTVVMKFITVPAYQDRAFWILWAPRALEELIMCLIQAYLIAVLYDIYVTKIKDRIAHA